MPNCRYHIILAFQKENNVLEKLKDLCFKYCIIDDMYNYYKYFIHDTVIVKCGEKISTLSEAIDYARGHHNFIQRPSEDKKRVKRKAFPQHLPSNLNSVFTQTFPEQALQQRIATILRGRHAHDFYKIVDALCDQHGSFESNNIVFMLKK